MPHIPASHHLFRLPNFATAYINHMTPKSNSFPLE